MTKKRIAAFGLSVAMFAAVATPASAQTIAELQTQIAALMAQIAALQTGGTTTATASFTQDLTVGSTGPQVVALQQYLVARGHLVMPAGVAMGYFGPLTRSAVAAWQAANGVSPAAGYWGPISRAKANASGGITTGGTVGGGTTTGTGALQGGAGDITVTERSSGVENEVLEGENDVRVLGFEIEADGSDVRINNVRIQLQHTGATGSDRLDRYADEVCVFMGNTSLGCADADDFSESGDVYTENISTDGIVREDNTERFHIAVSAVNNIDSTDLGTDWTITLDNVRFQDAQGAIITEETNIDEVFTFEDLASTGDIELTVREDDDDVNDAQTIQVSDTSDTNGVEILSFTIEAEGSDLELEDIHFDITSSNAGITEIANDFRLMMGNTEVGTLRFDIDSNNTAASAGDSMASTTDAAAAVWFVDLDDDDVVIEEGDEVSFTLVADINDIDGGFSSGDSLSVTLAGADVNAEDENGDTVTDLNGTVTSGPLAFASTGIMVNVTSAPSPEGIPNTPDSNSDNQGKFVMEFDVTAFEDTAWIELDAASSTDAAASDVGVAFSMETSGDVDSQTGTTTGVLTRISGGTVSGNFVRINDGQTAKFRLEVYHDPSATGVYRVQMNDVGYALTQVAATLNKDLTPTADYQSSSIQILE